MNFSFLALAKLQESPASGYPVKNRLDVRRDHKTMDANALEEDVDAPVCFPLSGSHVQILLAFLVGVVVASINDVLRRGEERALARVQGQGILPFFHDFSSSSSDAGASESKRAEPESRHGGDRVMVTEARSKHRHRGDDDGQVAFMSSHKKHQYAVTVLKREAKEKPVHSRGRESSPRADSRQELFSCKSLFISLSLPASLSLSLSLSLIPL
jgi:hypothetical protein